MWTKTYGGTGDDWSYSNSQTSDGGYIITGCTASYSAGHWNVYLIKTDSSGNVSGIGSSNRCTFPKAFTLSQNYPNPFNPNTEISYTLPKDSPVKLEVYNISGQKVATLVDGNQKAGTRSVRWGAKELSSGIYLCRLKARDCCKTIRMILLK